MPAKIFVNYRRDDDPSGAARVRDGLAAKFDQSNIFMDVDNLLAGQRFNQELAKALDACDVLIAIVGPRWLELLKAKATSGERDYVREEIAAALKRGIVVIPVRVGREGNMPALPRVEDLPEDIRELIDFQKHDVPHEGFRRAMDELNAAITAVRKTMQPQRPAVVSSVPWGWIGATAFSVMAIGYAGAYSVGVPLPWPWSPAGMTAEETAYLKARADDTTTAWVVYLNAHQQGAGSALARQRLAELRKADEEARAKAAAEAKRKTDDEARVKAAAEAERQRVAALEAKRKADEEVARRTPQPAQTFRDCNDGCPEMVVVPAGSFTMGSPSNEASRSDHEGPQRNVTIRQAFAVGKFEVTFGEWEACVADGGCQSNKNPDDRRWGKGRRPVIDVLWHDAKEYATWLSRKTGKAYRLLSEAEWEYASRAGTTTKYAYGDTITSRQAQVSDQVVGSANRTVEVGNFLPNQFGLHDMHGNVWEFVEDNYHKNYDGAPNDGSVRRGGDTTLRIMRGGAWYNLPSSARSAVRFWQSPTDRQNGTGFRVARSL